MIVKKGADLRKFLSAMFMVSLLLSSTLCACANPADNPPDEAINTTQTPSNVLIAYFAVAENSEVDAVASASVFLEDGVARGLVRVLADSIKENTGGDLFSIQTSVQYPADIGSLIDYAADEQDQGVRPELITHIENLDTYDTVFIGYPLWWYDLPMVMYSFFEEYDFSGKTIIPFSTHNGSRFSNTISTIQSLEPNATVVTEGFTVSQDDIKGAGADISAWLNSMGF